MSSSFLVFFFFVSVNKNDFVNPTSLFVFLGVFLFALPSTNLATSSSVKDRNISLTEFSADFSNSLFEASLVEFFALSFFFLTIQLGQRTTKSNWRERRLGRGGS